MNLLPFDGAATGGSPTGPSPHYLHLAWPGRAAPPGPPPPPLQGLSRSHALKLARAPHPPCNRAGPGCPARRGRECAQAVARQCTENEVGPCRHILGLRQLSCLVPVCKGCSQGNAVLPTRSTPGVPAETAGRSSSWGLPQRLPAWPAAHAVDETDLLCCREREVQVNTKHGGRQSPLSPTDGSPNR